VRLLWEVNCNTENTRLQFPPFVLGDTQ
jgi:hypothetical protein